MTRRLASLALALSVAVVSAQTTPAPQQPTVTLGYFPGDNFQNTVKRSAELSLLLDPLVVADLKLSDEQMAALKKVPDAVLAKHKEAIAKSDLEEKKAVEKARIEVAPVAKETDRKVEDLLAKYLTEEQRKRNRQIVIQSMGMGAFEDDAVVKALNLSEAQKVAAKKAADELGAESQKISNEIFPIDGPITREMSVKLIALRREAARKAVEAYVKTLTAEQTQTWTKLVGEPSAHVLVFIRTPLSNGFRPFVTVSTSVSRQTRFWLMTSTRFSGPSIQPTIDICTQDLKISEEKLVALRAELTKLDDSISHYRSRRINDFAFTQLLSADAAKAVMEILKPEQSERLTQIRRQTQGTWAFEVPELLTKLKITPEQSTAIEATLGEMLKKYISETKEVTGSSSQGSNREKRNQFGVNCQAAVIAVLNDEQKAICAKHFGSPIDAGKLGATTPEFNRGSFSATETAWSPATGWQSVAFTHTSSGKYAEAKAAFEESLRLKPDNNAVKMNLAWQLATCPDDAIRNGKRAVELALQVCEKNEYKSENWVSTLAAAYAEAGQFEDAVKTQEKAIALVKTSQRSTFEGVVTGYETRLKLYREKKPYRTAAANPSRL